MIVKKHLDGWNLVALILGKYSYRTVTALALLVFFL